MGFGGARLQEGVLRIAPKLPAKWTGMTFPLCYQGCRLSVTAGRDTVQVKNQGAKDLTLYLYDEKITIPAGAQVERGI